MLLRDVYAEFGWRCRLAAPIIGRVIFHLIRREEKRLAAGWTYEPPTFYETNHALNADGGTDSSGAAPRRFVTPRVAKSWTAGASEARRREMAPVG